MTRILCGGLLVVGAAGVTFVLTPGCGTTFDGTCMENASCDGGPGEDGSVDVAISPNEASAAETGGDTSTGPDASPSDDGPSNDGPSVDSADAACTCPTVPNGSATCVDGGCVTTCDTSYLLCNGTCHSESAGPSDSCVVTDTLAVFVSTGGSATGAGTQAAPVATVNQALTIAVKNNVGRIYVCGGTYTSAVTLSAGAPAVAVYGGFDCSTPSQWTYAPTTQKTVVAPTAHGYALEINGVTSAVSIEGIEFDAQNGVAAGDSSIAAFVTGSTGVTLTSVTLFAGTGVTGTSGVTPTAALPVPTDGTSGANGGTAATCTCTNSGTASVGGKGGINANGDPGQPNLGGGAGGDATKPCIAGGGNGGDGAGGQPINAASGAPTVGSLSATGWTTTNGSPGAVGGPGQGGGGGASPAAGETGGGGACGGCGGSGASPGLGGGSSIALLVYQSGVTLATSTLTAKNAGDGGEGRVGQAGVGGGTRGNGDGACNGGNGGAGAQGGASGGGSGGVSVGVLYSSTGNAPTIDPQTTAAIVTATAGKSGQGGATPTNDGKAGVAKAVLAYP